MQPLLSPKDGARLLAAIALRRLAFDPSQPRDDQGQWTDTGVGPSTDTGTRALDLKAVHSMAQRYGGWLKTLPSADRDAVMLYTGSEYREVNRAFWRNESPALGLRVQEVLAKAPKPPAETVVWRGVDHRRLDVEPGDEVLLKGLQSASLDPDFARKAYGVGTTTTLEIRPKTGAYVRELGLSHEYEFLIPHGQTFRVRGTKDVTYPDGTRGRVIQLDQQ